MKHALPSPAWSCRIAAFVALAGLAFVSGCGPTKDNTLKGKVTLKKMDGTVVPVTGGSIKFLPAGAPPSSTVPGTIGPDGNFSVSGVPNATLTVLIDTREAKTQGGYPATRDGGAGMPTPPKDAPTPAGGGGGGPPPVFVEIPLKYAQATTSGILWDVKKDGYTKDIVLIEE
jgi:hypothetical protein